MKINNPDSISICLNCYKIRFTEKYKGTQKSVTNVFGKNDLVSIMNDFIKIVDSKKVFKNKKGDRILYIKESLKASNNENVFIGVIMKGHSGPQTAIDEVVGSEVKNVGTVSKDQFHCIPYLFLVYVNKEKPNDILFIAQSYRQYGFKEVFEECFKEFVSGYSDSTTVNFSTLSVAKLFEKHIQDGFISKIRFVKYGLQSTLEPIVKGDKTNHEEYEMELSIKSKKGFWGIKKQLKYDDASFIEQIKIDGFEYSEAYVDLIIAGKKRIFNVTKPTEFSTAYDITNDVNINSHTKLPNFEDIMRNALDILNNDLIPFI